MLRLLALLSASVIAPVAIASGSDFFSAGTIAEQCQVLAAWTSQIRLTGPVTRDNQLYEAARVAFENVHFLSYFGNAYLDLSEAQISQIHSGFSGCFRDWRSNYLAHAFLPPIRTEARLWRDEVGSGPKAEAAKRAQVESRDPLSKLLLQTDDAFVYGRACSAVNNGVRIVESPVVVSTIDLVSVKDPSYLLVPSNPRFRAWFESAVIPAIAAYCQTSREIYVNNFIAGSRINSRTFAETPARAGSDERPINTFAFQRTNGVPKYRMVGPMEESLAAVRELRAKVVDAERSTNAQYQAAAKGARDEWNAVVADREKIRTATLVALERDKETASPAMRWLRPILLAHGSTRSEILKNLGAVRVSDSSTSNVTSILPQSEQRAAIRAAVEQLGLRIDNNALATLSIRLDGTRATAKYDAGMQHLEVPIAGVWAVASIEVPATILRERGLVRSSAAIATGMDTRMIARSDFDAGSVRGVIAKSIAQLKDEAADDAKRLISDNDWMDALIPHLRVADALYQTFQRSVALSHDGAETLLSGIENCCISRTAVSKFNKYSDLVLVPIPEIVTPPGLQYTERRYVDGFEPWLQQEFLGAGEKIAHYGFTDLHGSAVVGIEYVYESNCIVSSNGALARSTCEVAVHPDAQLGLGGFALMKKLADTGDQATNEAFSRDRNKLGPGTDVLFPSPLKAMKVPPPVKPAIVYPPGSLISQETQSVLYLIQRSESDPALVKRYKYDLPIGVDRMEVLECRYAARSGSADQPEVRYFWFHQGFDLTKILPNNPARIKLLHAPVVQRAPQTLDEADRLAPPARY
jgi:hypothetical protein